MKAILNKDKPVTTIAVNMLMGSCENCDGPIARIDMPGAPESFNHVLTQSEDCAEKS